MSLNYGPASEQQAVQMEVEGVRRTAAMDHAIAHAAQVPHGGLQRSRLGWIAGRYVTVRGP